MRYLFDKIDNRTNYLVELNEPDELDEILMQYLGHPSAILTQHNSLWGKKAEWLSNIGRKLGWIPNHLPFTFFNETVIAEIGCSFISNQNKLECHDIELRKAKILLEKLEIANLADQNPYLLSTGESRLVWFLMQWAKQSQSLVSGHLPTSLSPIRLMNLLNFILHSDELASQLEIDPPQYVLGFCANQTDWFDCLLAAQSGWKKIKINDLIDKN